MRRLILLRHAEAESEAVGGDFHRGLTERGRLDARQAGTVLAARGMVPDLALVSTARRAIETWEAAAPAFPQAQLSLDPELYNAEAAELMAAVLAAEADTLMIVAHNPGLQVLSIELLTRAGARGQADLRLFAPATAAVFAFEGVAPRFEAVIRPEGG
jgi:phosphohistidine phosphatase